MLPPSTYIIAQIKKKCCYFCVTLKSGLGSLCYYISNVRKHRRFEAKMSEKRCNGERRLIFTPKNTKSPWKSRTFVLGCKIEACHFNEIVLRTMKSSRCLDEIFGVTPQMKLNPPLLSRRSRISSRGDFPHRRWISSAIGGFNWKKHLQLQVLFSGSPCWTWTNDSLINSQVLYRLS